MNGRDHTCPTCGQPVTSTHGKAGGERPLTLRLRVSPAEKAALRKAAEDAGETLSRYIRDRIF
jgi:hypothetical protein